MSETTTITIRMDKKILNALKKEGITTTIMREWIIEKFHSNRKKKAFKEIDKIRAKTKYGVYNSTEELIKWRRQ